MSKSYLLIALLFLIASCKKTNINENQKTEPAFNDPDWSRIKVPNAGGIYAIAGSIDDTLLVTTMTKAYFTTDKGVSWQESMNFNGPVPGLLIIKDTIYALVGSGYDEKFEKSYAGISQYYTLNKGLNWHSSSSYNSYKSMQTGIAPTKNKDVFRLNYHTGPDKNDEGTSWVLQTTIVKTDSIGNTIIFSYPFDDQPLNLHIDKKDRLYVACSGGSFSEFGVFISPSLFDPAYIYFTKDSVNSIN